MDHKKQSEMVCILQEIIWVPQYTRLTPDIIGKMYEVKKLFLN